VIAVAAALCAGAFAYAASHIAIDTDSTKLIAGDVDWRKHEVAFDAAFPQRTDLIVVVVDAATPELAEQSTATLTQRFTALPELFQAVWRPDGGPFFDRAGLLFQSADEVAETTRTLIATQPMLSMLAVDSTVRGFSTRCRALSKACKTMT